MGQVSIGKALWEQLPPEFQQAVTVGMSPAVTLGEPAEQEVDGETVLVWDDDRLPGPPDDEPGTDLVPYDGPEDVPE